MAGEETERTESACCAAASAVEPGLCPSSGTKGLPVKGVTVAAQLGAPSPPDDAFWLCTDPECPVVYFGADGTEFGCDALLVEPGFKNPHDGLLCYCFGHTRGDIERDVADTGETSIPESIRGKVRAGLCSCETLNPSGRCCLGDVARFVRSVS